LARRNAMSRKRFHSSRRPRQSPGSERSYHEYILSRPAPAATRTELVRLLRGGEDTYLELKVRFSNIEKITAEIIALANTGGGAMIFGVNDQLRVEGVADAENVEQQLREICAQLIQPPVFPYLNKVAFDNGRRIVVLEVDAQDRPHRTLDHKFYLREGATKREATREELSRLYQEAYLTRFEQVPVFQARIEDIDEALFWSYVRGVNPGYWGSQAKGFPTDYVLRDMGLALSFGETLVPTLGALLLFGLHERVTELLPQAGLLLTRFGGVNADAPMVERVHLRGNLFRLFEGALGFVQRYADLWEARPSRRARLDRQIAPETAETLPPEAADAAADGEEGDDSFLRGRANYHRGVAQEALINALVHRDWSAQDRPARLNLYDDSLELINPAQMIELPIISLRYGVTSAPNPRLKAVFTNRHSGVPLTQGGIPMIFEEATAFARHAPEGPTITNGEFRLKIFGLC
jgi:ATP-dependent DNA helicase RecG